MKKVLFISCIGLKNPIPNGVSVKNKHILKYLRSIKDIRVSVMDTDNWRMRIFQLLFQTSMALFSKKKIVLSINTMSAYQIIRVLYFLGFDKKIIYFVVGGSFHEQISKGILNQKYYRNISKIFVQTKIMESGLKKVGFKNVQTLPNSKYFEDLKLDFNRSIGNVIRCFYIGRITKNKGIDLIFESFQKINSKSIKYIIDFYGPIEKKYEEYFLKKINEFDFTNFNGSIQLIDNTENYYKLSEYDLFVFPTFHHGEGFPGVVIDSFISGVPVLASDWNHNAQVIQDGYNGILFKAKKKDSLIAKLEFLYENKKLLSEMRSHAQESSKKYKTDNVLKVLDSIILT